MSASTITIPNTPRTLTSQGIISSGGLVFRSFAGDGQQAFAQTNISQTQGGSFETIGGAGGGLVQNRRYAQLSTWVAGRSYNQWGVVQSSINSQAYTKTTAGTLVSNTDPSADAVNWALLSTQPGASVFNGNELVAEGVFLQGNAPAQIQWLAEGLGMAASLTGRPANGSGTSDANLRVNGGVSAEGLYVQNGTNHLEDPAAGTGLASYELGFDYYFPGGVPTATTPGGPAPAKYGLPGNVFPAHLPSQSRIFTLASDPLSLVLLTRTGTGGGVAGELSVPLLGKLGTYFTVQSIDPATGAVYVAPTADTGTFQWLIVNPAW
jgi:hypothetical protein